MYHRPFLDEVQSPVRQFAFDDLQGADVDGGLELAVSSVRVRRRVVIEKHPDQDPVERADRRHLHADFTT
jgi:hypothetical protein